MISDHRARFGSELRRAMQSRGLRVRDLAAEVGYPKSNLSEARQGRHVPGHEAAAKLADALDCPSLVEIAESYRTATCAQCGKTFLGLRAPGTRVFCDHNCRQLYFTDQTRQERLTSSHKRLQSATAMANAYKRKVGQVKDETRARDEAIARFCRSCEWDGLCKTPECELREFSPFPLAKRVVA